MAPRLSLLLEMGRGCRFFQGTNILSTEKYFVIESQRFGHNCLNQGDPKNRPFSSRIFLQIFCKQLPNYVLRKVKNFQGRLVGKFFEIQRFMAPPRPLRLSWAAFIYVFTLSTTFLIFTVRRIIIIFDSVLKKKRLEIFVYCFEQ